MRFLAGLFFAALMGCTGVDDNVDTADTSKDTGTYTVTETGTDPDTETGTEAFAPPLDGIWCDDDEEDFCAPFESDTEGGEDLPGLGKGRWKNVIGPEPPWFWENDDGDTVVFTTTSSAMVNDDPDMILRRQD